jgi:hypothetical protein
MTIHKLRISFTGIASNAAEDLAKLEEMAAAHEDYEEEDSNLAYSVSSCISAFRDTLLALARGDTTIDEVKDFWFHNADPAQIPYDGTVIKFTEKNHMHESKPASPT